MLVVRKELPGLLPKTSLFNQSSNAVLGTEVRAGPHMAPNRGTCERDCEKGHPPSFMAQLHGRSALLWLH